jgi:pyruvate/2-oxoglutarate dehydrogenase complex dihydrolipoamide dehydrogenase (E3) component
MLECTYLIIGSGKTSLQLAQELNKTGKKIIIIEKADFGGQYFNSFDSVYDSFLEIGKYFQDSLKLFRDYPATFEVLDKFRKTSFLGLNKIRNENVKKIKTALESVNNIELIKGKARFISNSLIEVINDDDRKILSFENIYICIGKKAIPKNYNIDDFERAEIIDRFNILNLKKLPEHILIPECNFESINIANLFSNLGVKVTIVDHKKPQDCFKHFDQTILNLELKNQIRKKVDFYFKSKVTKITKSAKQFFASIEGDTTKKIKVSHIYSQFDNQFEDTLNLKEINIDYDKNGIKTSFQKTANDSKIYVFGSALANFKEDEMTYLVSKHVEGQIKNLIKKDKNYLTNDKYEFLDNLINFPPEIFYSIAPVSKLVDYQSLNLGISEMDALSRFGPQVKIEIYKTESVTIKVVFNSLNNMIFGIGLYGEINPYYGICLYMFHNKKTSKDVINALKDTKTVLSLK